VDRRFALALSGLSTAFLAVLAGGCAQPVGSTGGGNDGGADASRDAAPRPSDAGADATRVDASDGCKRVGPSNVCGLDPQCGCGAGQTCDVDFQALDGTTSCVPATGSGGIKAPCATTKDCSAGLTCVFKTCRPYCESDGVLCGKSGTNVCAQLNDGQTPIPNLKVCRLDCSLDDANACGGNGVGCIYLDQKDRTDCYPVGTSSTCSANQGFCAPGYNCVILNGTQYACKPWCRVGGSTCTGGTTCQGFNPAVEVGGQTWGVCL
jgi:hypothetical protein